MVAVLPSAAPARRELRVRKLGAAAAGAAFAYAPYRVTEAGNLHVISSSSFWAGDRARAVLLLRGYRRSSRGLVIAGGSEDSSRRGRSLGFHDRSAVRLPEARSPCSRRRWWREGRKELERKA